MSEWSSRNCIHYRLHCEILKHFRNFNIQTISAATVFLSAVSEICFLSRLSPYVYWVVSTFCCGKLLTGRPSNCSRPNAFHPQVHGCNIHVSVVLTYLAVSVACKPAVALIGGELWAWHSWVKTGCGVRCHGTHSICGHCSGRCVAAERECILFRFLF